MPRPSHYQDFTCIGAVQEVIWKGGKVVWIAFEVDQREPCLLALSPGRCAVPPDLARGDLLHVRGEWFTERGQCSRYGMPYLVATRVLERLGRGRPAINAGATASGGLARAEVQEASPDAVHLMQTCRVLEGSSVGAAGRTTVHRVARLQATGVERHDGKLMVLLAGLSTYAVDLTPITPSATG